MAEESPAVMRNHARRSSKAFLLHSLTIGEFLQWKHQVDHASRSLLYVTTTDRLSDAMRLLKENSVLSVPIWNKETLEWVAFLSVVDLLRYCVGDREGNQETTVSMSDTLAAIVPDLENDEGAFLDILNEKMQLSKALELFTLGLHRVLVEDPNGASSPSGFIISQSDVVRYLQANKQTSEDLDKTLQELGFLAQDRPTIGPKKLSTVPTDAIALDAFVQLYDDRTNGVAVVDTDQTLVENLSVSDLRGITEGDVERQLLLPVLDFLAERQGVLASRNGPLTCHPNATLREAIELLSENRAHRVWMVDQNRKLLGVVTLTDVLCKFAPFDYKLLHSNKV